MALKAKNGNGSTFKNGVTADDDVVAVYLVDCSSEAQEAITNSGKSMKELAAVVRQVKGAGPEVDGLRVQALEDFADELSGDDDSADDTTDDAAEAPQTTKTQTDLSIRPKLASAISFAKALDAEANKAIEDEVIASEKKKRGALPVLYHLLRTHPGGKDQPSMDDVPEPGTEETTTSADGTVHKHNIFEFYKRQVSREGVKRLVTASWFRDVIEDSAYGRSIIERQAALALDPKGKNTPQWVKRMTNAERKGETNKLASRMGDAVNLLRRAARVHHQINKFKLIESKVKWSWIAQNGGNTAPGMNSREAFERITTGTTPFYIYDPTDTTGQRQEVASITTFLSYNPEQALDGDNGGDIEDLWATAGRETGAGKVPNVYIPQQPTLAHVEEMATALAWFWDDAKRLSDTYTLFRKGDNRKAMVLTFGSIYGHMQTIWDKIQRDYERFQSEGLTPEEAAAQARKDQATKLAAKHNAAA